MEKQFILKHPDDGRFILIIEGEKGYFEVSDQKKAKHYFEEVQKLSEEEKESIMLQSMFGWSQSVRVCVSLN